MMKDSVPPHRSDYHKKYSYVVLKDREGKMEQRGKVNNSKEVPGVTEALSGG